MIAAVLAATAAATALVPASAGTSPGRRPPLALAASPTRLVLDGSAWSTVRVTNPGRAPVDVGTATTGFALDLSGRPHAAARSGDAPAWLVVAPHRIHLAAGRSAYVTVSARAPRGALPGEHDALLLLQTRTRSVGPVPIVMQVGVVIVVRVKGPTIHRLEIRSLRVRRVARRRLLLLTLRNRGNVAEVLPRRRVRIVLRRGRRFLATLLPPRRELLPRSLGVLSMRYAGGARGTMTAIVVLRRPRAGVAVVRRSFRVRL